VKTASLFCVLPIGTSESRVIFRPPAKEKMPINVSPVFTPGIYFITFTCYRWLHLIEISGGYRFVYNWFEVMATNGHFVNAYVVMPNHIHLLLYYNGGQSLNKVIGNGKRFMAYDIVQGLRDLNNEKLLLELHLAVDGSDRRNGKCHEIWERSFDCKPCRTEKFVLQKLHYIHNNPCRKNWKLADSPVDYLHSSAAFYFYGKQGQFATRDYREFLPSNDEFF
jgi:REP element-mobilizing transposase RayT